MVTHRFEGDEECMKLATSLDNFPAEPLSLDYLLSRYLNQREKAGHQKH